MICGILRLFLCSSHAPLRGREKMGFATRKEVEEGIKILIFFLKRESGPLSNEGLSEEIHVMERSSSLLVVTAIVGNEEAIHKYIKNTALIKFSTTQLS